MTKYHATPELAACAGYPVAKCRVLAVERLGHNAVVMAEITNGSWREDTTFLPVH